MSEKEPKTPIVVFYGYKPEMHALVAEQFDAGTYALNRGAANLESLFIPIYISELEELAKVLKEISPIAVIHEFKKEEVRGYTNGTPVHEYSSLNTPGVGVIPLMRVIFAAKLK